MGFSGQCVVGAQLLLRSGQWEWLVPTRQRLFQEGAERRVVLDKVIGQVVVRFHRLDRDQPMIGQLDDEGLPRVAAPTKYPLRVGLRSLNGITFVCMELLAFDDEGISNHATDDHDDHIGALLVHVVEDSKVTEPQLVAGQGIRSKHLGRPTRECRLNTEPRRHPVGDDLPLPGWQLQELGFGVRTDYHAIRHIAIGSGTVKTSEASSAPGAG